MNASEDSIVEAQQERIRYLEKELDDMTAALAQAWDQLVPFLKAAPQHAESTRDIAPLLETIMAAVDASMGAVYLVAHGERGAEWFALPAEVVSLGCVQKDLDDLVRHGQPVHVSNVIALNAKPTHWMFTPLLVDGTVVGAIGVGLDEGHREFSAADARLVLRMTERISSQMVAADLAASKAREAKLAHELQIAGLIQRSIQPASEPQIDGVEVAADWQPAASVGGDAWGWVVQPSGQLACFMVDVAGKGLPAALAAVSLHTALKMVLRLGLSPVDVLRTLNNEFYDAYTSAGILATATVVTLDPETGAVEQANAGHPPSLLWKNGEWIRWRATMPPLGVVPDAEPIPQRARLADGDMILLYSDGLSEIETEQGWWRDDGLIRVASQLQTPRSARHLINAILETAGQIRAGKPLHDDQTIVGICFRGADDSAVVHKLVLPARFEVLEGLKPFITELTAPVPEKIQSQIILALHELCINIVSHAYAGAEGEIQIEAVRYSDRIQFTIHDTGPHAYILTNSVDAPDPANLPEGGWGIYILHQVMDRVEYRRLSASNEWYLEKRLPQ
ncbi:MAG TPA: SpoIIE family protein phosphatase [Oceanobacillus sp.]|nr:SpoIIE family protein phosphatase [Oceanobacillus sp.]